MLFLPTLRALTAEAVARDFKFPSSRWKFAYFGTLGLCGFYGGLVSYQQQCVDKILALENSKLADDLRQRMNKVCC